MDSVNSDTLPVAWLQWHAAGSSKVLQCYHVMAVTDFTGDLVTVYHVIIFSLFQGKWFRNI